MTDRDFPANYEPSFPSGDGGGISPGTEDGNVAGRGSIGVTAGPVAIGRGAALAARGGSFVFAARRFGALAFFALRAGFFGAARRALTFFRRAGAARFLAFTTFFFAFRFLAMSLSLLWATH
jgi:hypothetical protein